MDISAIVTVCTITTYSKLVQTFGMQSSIQSIVNREGKGPRGKIERERKRDRRNRETEKQITREREKRERRERERERD